MKTEQIKSLLFITAKELHHIESRKDKQNSDYFEGAYYGARAAYYQMHQELLRALYPNHSGAFTVDFAKKTIILIKK